MEHCPDHSNLMEKIGNIEATVSHIAKKVDNGLSQKLENVDKTLTKFMDSSAAQRRVDIAENWFGRILQGSVLKIIGFAVLIIIVSALTSGGVWSALRTYAWQESPGQLKTIIQQGKNIEAQNEVSQFHDYHQHIMKDGRILFHAGHSDVAAYILDPKTGKYARAPYLRTEESIK
jgi:hypothetical protein